MEASEVSKVIYWLKDAAKLYRSEKKEILY
jgi:hypothetical protein